MHAADRKSHTGLKAAIAGVLLGTSWQRCRVHFLRNGTEWAEAGAGSPIFHLTAVVSGEAEADFDPGYRVNTDGTRALLDAVRAADGTH